jgi:hypothetical protein
MEIKHIKVDSFLAVAISFILFFTLISVLHQDLAETDILFSYQTLEVFDQECLLIYDDDSFNKLELTFFSDLSQPTFSLAKIPSYSFFETASLNQKTVVLRC